MFNWVVDGVGVLKKPSISCKGYKVVPLFKACIFS